jgi:hypothetical protein
VIARERVLCYRRRSSSPNEPPHGWDLSVIRAPYEHEEHCPPVGTLSRRPAAVSSTVIVARCLGDTDVSMTITELRHDIPWATIVLRPPSTPHMAQLASVMTRAARSGAVLLPPGVSSAPTILACIRESLDPVRDLPLYLRSVMPLWPAVKRETAVWQFSLGMAQAQRQRSRMPCRQPLWLQVGRATLAAVTRQELPHLSSEKVAAIAGYSDSRSMERALSRAFGVQSREIRGTAGVEWLFWRFLSGQGAGKARNWARLEGRA